MNIIPLHKVFISYYHADDQDYKDSLLESNEVYKSLGRSIFKDYSVHEDEIDDTGKSDERIRQIIRDAYIRDAEVLVLLCGENTAKRKHIDWEIHAAMFNTDLNPKMGILVINLPTISQVSRAKTDVEKSIVSPNGSWTSYKTRKQYEDNFTYMPSRIIDNFESGISDSDIISISVVDWSRIYNNPENMRTLIDIAYQRANDNSRHYDHSVPLRRRNS